MSKGISFAAGKGIWMPSSSSCFKPPRRKPSAKLHLKVGEGHTSPVLEIPRWQGATLECPIPCHYLEEELLLPAFAFLRSWALFLR